MISSACQTLRPLCIFCFCLGCASFQNCCRGSRIPHGLILRNTNLHPSLQEQSNKRFEGVVPPWYHRYPCYRWSTREPTPVTQTTTTLCFTSPFSCQLHIAVRSSPQFATSIFSVWRTRSPSTAISAAVSYLHNLLNTRELCKLTVHATWPN